MKKLARILGILSMALVVVTQANAADRKADVTALMEKAIAHFNQVGAEQAYKDFSNKDGGFIVDDMYVVVQDLKGTMVHHSTLSKLNGRNVMKLKDADGKVFNKDMLDALAGSDNTWVRYKWSNPKTKKIGQKNSYVHKVGSDLIFIIGYYE
jgi:cytochrome c